MVRRMVDLSYVLHESSSSHVNQKLRGVIVSLYACVVYDGEEGALRNKKS